MVSWLILLTQLLGGILGARCALNHPETYSGFLDPKPPEIPCIHPASISNKDKSEQGQLRLDIGPSTQNFNPETRIQVDKEELSSEGSSATRNPIIDPPILDSQPRCTGTFPIQGSVPASDVTEDSTTKPTDQNEEERNPCSVCLEEMIMGGESKIVSLLNCSHHFHRDCIAKWVESNHPITCPCCRKIIATKKGLKVRDVSNNEESVLVDLPPSGLLTSNDVQLGLSTSNHFELGLPTSNRSELVLINSNRFELSCCTGLVLFLVCSIIFLIWYLNKHTPSVNI